MLLFFLLSLLANTWSLGSWSSFAGSEGMVIIRVNTSVILCARRCFIHNTSVKLSTLGGGYYYNANLADEKIEAQSNLPKVSQLVSAELKF